MDRNALIRALRDTAQSASNAIASNVSGPVDLIAAGLRGVGLPIPQNPVGGSQWMAERGLTAPVQQGVAQVIGDTIGLAGPALVANFAPQIASALNRGAQNLAAPRTLRPETGAIVWHGSPHKFDRFDSSKIGTGEGAQSYGHGLYLAESPDVAAQYQRNLGGVEMRDKAGKVVPIPENVAWVAKDLAAAGGDYNKVRAQLAEHGKMYPWPAEVGTKYINELEAAGVKPADLGSLYKVDLPDEQIARMLDWDKPLSQQAPEVRALLQSADRRAKDSLYQNGGEYYRALMSRHAQNAAPHLSLDVAENMAQGPASQQLRELGIPGIRYLDGVSRGVGEGTSNFVVFPGNENILQILERNGQPLGPLNRQAGAVYAGGPRQEALDTAQRNAAKPVSEGGLGLPPNNTPMDRARAMGFNTNVFHGTAADISEFNPAMFGTNTRASGDELGIFTTAKTDLANQYAEIAGRGGWYGRRSPGDANVMPLLARMQSPKKYETASSFYKEADVAAANRALGEMRRNLQREGFDSVQVRPDLEEVVIFDPSNLRSRFAAFDPARINENDLLGRADPRLLGLMGLGAAGGLGAYNYMQGQ